MIKEEDQSLCSENEFRDIDVGCIPCPPETFKQDEYSCVPNLQLEDLQDESE